ncbi:MAG: EAL domain-containing protein, partial [Gammaproteobacteria bacterium]|nr:EAL domain-containing protein [Gammaproteobacteria bacterium]
LVSVEALVRWQHPDYGLLPPASFVGLAEKTGLISPLTEAVVEKSFEHAAVWHNDGIPLKVAINVSGASLADLTLPDKLTGTANKFSLAPENIVVEITESWVAKNSIDALDILTRLRMKGFSLSIDDFGTGYSTMLKLKQIPFSELKLDQSIIRGAATDEESRAIVETSIELGHRLGLHLVAEGVEKQDDWDLISELGCNEGQGFFIARPMKPLDLPDWLQRWNLSLGI